MKKTMVGILAAASLVLVPAMMAQKADSAAGKKVYDAKCAMCHGADGAGKPAMAKALKVEFKHLGSKEVLAKTDEQLKKETVEGVGKMKGVKLSDADVANVIAYMRTLKP